MSFSRTYITTPAGSRIAVYESGPQDGPSLFVAGGYSSRPVSEGALADAVAAASGPSGMRAVMIDNAACGDSRHCGDLTMDTWLDDMQFVARAVQASDGLCVGASVGAWLMLLLHQRGRLPFSGLCALAPAIDWGEQYIHPGLRERRFVEDGAFITSEGQPLVPTSLLDSMSRYTMLDDAYTAAAPIHIIHGDVDELAPISASRSLVDGSTGADCTLDRVEDEGHDVSKLSTPASRAAFDRWLGARQPLQ